MLTLTDLMPAGSAEDSMQMSDEIKRLRECAKMLRRGQKACERQGWEKGESAEAWYHAAGTLASQIEINYGGKNERQRKSIPRR